MLVPFYDLWSITSRPARGLFPALRTTYRSAGRGTAKDLLEAFICDMDHIQCDDQHVLLRQRTLRAVRIGRYAKDALASANAAGSVVSTFRRGVNVRITLPQRTVIVPFQTADVAFHPWAVEVQTALLTDPVSASPHAISDSAIGPRQRESDTITLRAPGHDIEVDLGMVVSFPLLITPFDAWGADRARQIAPRVQKRIRAKINDSPASSVREPLDKPIESILASWQTRDDTTALLDLVGLGSGATPNGDDLLVGTLAALHAWKLQAARANQLLTFLRERLPSTTHNTTTLSRQMIAAACDGAFAEPLVELIDATASARMGDLPLEVAISRVSSLGHRSGMYLLVGVLLGLDHVCTP